MSGDPTTVSTLGLTQASRPLATACRTDFDVSRHSLSCRRDTTPCWLAAMAAQSLFPTMGDSQPRGCDTHAGPPIAAGPPATCDVAHYEPLQGRQVSHLDG